MIVVAVTMLATQLLAASVGRPSEASAQERVALVETGGVYKIPVFINGIGPFPFILDSGAADVSITAEVFLTLVRIGSVTKDDYIGSGKYLLGNGTTQQSDKFCLQELRVGNRVLKRVAASV